MTHASTDFAEKRIPELCQLIVMAHGAGNNEEEQKWWEVLVDEMNANSERKVVQLKLEMPDVPNVMHDDSLTVMDNPTIRGAVVSFHNAQSRLDTDWNRGKGIPKFMYQKDNSTVIIELRPQGKKPDDDRCLTKDELEQVWAQLTGNGSRYRITSLTGIVLYTLLAHALSAPPDASGNRWITAEQILDYRDIEKVSKKMSSGKRRTAGHRTEDIEEIGAIMNQLDNTWVQLRVNIVNDTDSRGRKRQRVYSHQSKIIAISSTITQKEILPESTNPMPVAWAFALGTWAEPFLSGANRVTVEIPQQCLSYDTYHELWELRLAEYFTMALHANTKNSSTHQIGPLLNELSLPIDRDNPKNTRQSFERAMNRIRAENSGSLASWNYVGGKPKPKRYGWLDNWLKLSIEVKKN